MSVSTLSPSWRALADKAGGVEPLAAKLGVSLSTLYRWSHGVSPISGPGLILLKKMTKGNLPTTED